MNRDIKDIRRYSSDAKIFGVCSGIAIWAKLDIQLFRLIVFITVLVTGFFPGALIYLILALIIPPYEGKTSRYYDSPYEDNEDEDGRTTDELKKEYENLKKKVEDMENDMFDKERDWDQRFHQK